jgi:hypothetical protein
VEPAELPELPVPVLPVPVLPVPELAVVPMVAVDRVPPVVEPRPRDDDALPPVEAAAVMACSMEVVLPAPRSPDVLRDTPPLACPQPSVANSAALAAARSARAV